MKGKLNNKHCKFQDCKAYIVCVYIVSMYLENETTMKQSDWSVLSLTLTYRIRLSPFKTYLLTLRNLSGKCYYY